MIISLNVYASYALVVLRFLILGKHHCPKPRIKGNFSTAYTDHYKNVKIPASKSPPP